MKNRRKTVKDNFTTPLIVNILGGLIVTIFGGLILNSIIQREVISDSMVVSGITLEDISMPEDISVPEDTSTLEDISESENIPTLEYISASEYISATEYIPAPKENKEILASIQKISIGVSRDWVNNKLGSPYAQNIVKITENGRDRDDTSERGKVSEILECTYIFDIVSVIAYFDISDNSCKAFFVTLMENDEDIDIILPEAYGFFVSDKPLGKFSFADIWGDPLNIYGYVSNSVARAFYGEQYYYMGGGNYNDFYFAVLDYGMLNSRSEEFIDFLSEVQPATEIVFGSNNGEDVLSSLDLLVEQRSMVCPNTYGISTLNKDLTFSLFSSYLGFDSTSFRKRN